MNIRLSAKKVASHIKNLNSDFEWHECPFPYDHMGASIVDASLQAGLKYDSVVFPRVNGLRQKHPNCKTTSDFDALLNKTSLKDLIDWTHEEKLKRIEDAVRLFLRENVETEKDLFSWIKHTENQEKLKECRGIGPKTLDYYKLIAGHSTVAIDRHLQNFIRQAGGEASDYSAAHSILCDCASIMNRNDRDLDHSIWKYMSNMVGIRKSRKSCSC